jgi:hypothetical protein
MIEATRGLEVGFEEKFGMAAGHEIKDGRTSMDKRIMTRIMLEGALNGIGFVIGSALVGLVISAFLILVHHHLITVLALPIIGVVLWSSFRGRRVLKARLEGLRTAEFARTFARR